MISLNGFECSIPRSATTRFQIRPTVAGQEPELLEAASRIDHFAERSVAASGWTLVLDTKAGFFDALRISEMDDVEICFYHYTAERQDPL